MKTYYTSLCTFAVLTFGIAKSQVGIGTEFPANSSVLEIASANRGILIPRVSLTSTLSSSPLTGVVSNGTMVFNTVTAGTGTTDVIPAVYIWYNNEWVLPGNIGQLPNKAVQFKNKAASTTNFTAAVANGSVPIDIFGDQSFNDDTNVFEKIDDFQVSIKQAGLYVVILSLALRQNPQANNSDVADYLHFNLDGSISGADMATMPPQSAPASFSTNGRFALNLRTYFNASAGQILTLQSTRRGGSGTVNYDGASLSSVTIIKLK